MHQSLVLVHQLGCSELLPADVALEELQLLVDRLHVDLQNPLPGELLVTDVALEPFHLLVDLEDVSLQVDAEGEGVVALLTDKLLDAIVDRVDVVKQDVFAAKLLVAPESKSSVIFFCN